MLILFYEVFSVIFFVVGTCEDLDAHLFEIISKRLLLIPLTGDQLLFKFILRRLKSLQHDLGQY